MIKICVGGATGWVGRELVKAIIRENDLELIAAVSRSSAGKSLTEVFDIPDAQVTMVESVATALESQPDVYVDFTKPGVVKSHVTSALNAGIAVVIGTSGLSETDYEEIAALANSSATGVLAAGNFAITAVLLQRFAEMAARHIPHWEIIDYAGATKKDAPSGTARELASRLGNIRAPELDHPIEETIGPRESRGTSINGVQVHSLRVPGHVLSAEAVFGLPDERLSIRHDAGSSAAPYVAGVLLSIRKVLSFTGLKRGLDSVLDI